MTYRTALYLLSLTLIFALITILVQGSRLKTLRFQTEHLQNQVNRIYRYLGPDLMHPKYDTDQTNTPSYKPEEPKP